MESNAMKLALPWYYYVQDSPILGLYESYIRRDAYGNLLAEVWKYKLTNFYSLVIANDEIDCVKTIFHFNLAKDGMAAADEKITAAGYYLIDKRLSVML